MQIAEDLLIDTIKFNKGKAKEQSKHIQALEQLIKIFKDTTNAAVMRLTTPTAPTLPTESHLPTHKCNETSPQTHQQQPITPTYFFVATPSGPPPEPRQ